LKNYFDYEFFEKAAVKYQYRNAILYFSSGRFIENRKQKNFSVFLRLSRDETAAVLKPSAWLHF
jgi:hypothetical protein